MLLTDSSALDLARELTDYSAAPLATIIGDVRMDRAPMPADVIRACRRAARDHAARDPYAMPLPDVGMVVREEDPARALQWSETIGYSTSRTARALDRMREVRERREMRESGYGLDSARPLPWRACRVVGCMAPDPEYGANERYAVVVRYGARGALACYGVDRETSALSCYWD